MFCREYNILQKIKRNKLQRPPNSNKFNFKGPNKKLEKLKNQETGALPVLREYAHMNDYNLL